MNEQEHAERLAEAGELVTSMYSKLTSLLRDLNRYQDLRDDIPSLPWPGFTLQAQCFERELWYWMKAAGKGRTRQPAHSE